MVKLVNTRDLKSLGFGFAGSSPAARTKTSASLSGAPDALMIKQLNHHNLRQTDGLSGIDACIGQRRIDDRTRIVAEFRPK